jgi:hypothetical protein
MKDRAWFRLHVDAVDDEKLGLLAFEDRWHFVALLCCKAKGILDDTERPELIRRKVAHKLGLSLSELDNVARRLAEVGLIGFEGLQPLAWEARQYESDSSAERTREYRERLKQAKRHGDVTVTPPDTETEADTERRERVATQLPALRAEDRPPSSVSEIKKPKTLVPDCPHADILALWAEVLPALPQHLPSQWRGAREQHLKARWRECAVEKGWVSQTDGLEFFRRLFSYVGQSQFLSGRARSANPSRPAFQAELEWLVAPANWAKTLEGKYHQEAA